MARLSFQLATLLVVSSDAFSPLGTVPVLRANQPSLAFTSTSNAQLQQRTIDATALYSNEEGKGEGEVEEDKTPTPVTDGLQRQSESFTSAPPPQQRLDPLIASLTRVDEDMKNAPTTKVPLLGEIPLDGSIVVLLPVTIIAIVGFIMSINIAFSSKDTIVQKLDEVNAVLSAPPAKKAVVSEGCRGLCSNQDEQLDSMRTFMNSLAPKNVQEAAVQVVPVAPLEAVQVVPEVKEQIKVEVAPVEIKEEIKAEESSTPVATSEETKSSEGESEVVVATPSE